MTARIRFFAEASNLALKPRPRCWRSHYLSHRAPFLTTSLPSCSIASSTSHFSSAASPSTSDRPQSVSRAREHCLQLIRSSDYHAYILLPFIPPHVRDAYIAFHALNTEVSRVADLTSSPAAGALRLQFWREATKRAITGFPSPEPVATLLAYAAEELDARSQSLPSSSASSPPTPSFSLAWINRLISSREKRLANLPFVDLTAMETYAEHTYSTLLYLILSAYPMASVTVDHLASHIGKAAGLAALLRGIPVTAFPDAAVRGAGSEGKGSGMVVGGGGRVPRQGAVVLPLDVMAAAGVREEDVLRYGPDAKGLSEAVFTVATRANDHLITARTMLKQLYSTSKKTADETPEPLIDHPFEHEFDPDARIYPAMATSAEVSMIGTTKSSQHRTLTDRRNVEQAFGVLVSALGTRLWLEKLQKFDFNVFDDRLRRRDWKFPIFAYWAHRQRKI